MSFYKQPRILLFRHLIATHNYKNKNFLISGMICISMIKQMMGQIFLIKGV